MLKCFLSYKYNEDQELMADKIKKYLEVLEVKVVEGRNVRAGQSLSDQIKILIKDSDVLICLQFAGSSTTTSYLDQEAGFATGHDIPVILIVADPMKQRGLYDGDYYISLERGELGLATDLCLAMKDIRKRKNLSTLPPVTHHTPPDVIDREGWSPDVREGIRKIRDYMNQLDFEKALNKAEELWTENPHCWRAAIAITACIANLPNRKDEEAISILDRVIDQFSGNNRAISYAYHNKAAFLQKEAHGSSNVNLESTRRATEYYKKAIEFEPRFMSFIDLIECALELNEIVLAEITFADLMNLFPEHLNDFRKEVEARGSEFIKQITKSEIIRKLLFPNMKGGSGDDKVNI